MVETTTKSEQRLDVEQQLGIALDLFDDGQLEVLSRLPTFTQVTKRAERDSMLEQESTGIDKASNLESFIDQNDFCEETDEAQLKVQAVTYTGFSKQKAQGDEKRLEMFEGSIEEYIEGYFGVSYKPKKFKVNKHQLKWWDTDSEEGKKTNKCVLNFDLYECKVSVYTIGEAKKEAQASLDNPSETIDESKKQSSVDQRHLQLTILGCETSFIFRAESNESLGTILEFLQHHITQSRGTKF